MRRGGDLGAVHPRRGGRHRRAQVLVEMTEGFSPADIEYAARKASQSALERALELPPPAQPHAATGDG